ncbi:hypothetical protein [Aureliella helgolandensis]|uniref:Caspase domain protein n=1 Tax=Aureliella helgolandensis TaxID=2527968 RepID=A0A518G256_9BACT|nr:hypothetical protein [Aureliella helgolandensis]QDV22707.1 hypothetical protein Q31a_09930 [Aureliella helgolandensis]
MKHFSLHLPSLGIALSLLTTICTSCWAEDVFVILGGGPDPTSNQVSLERNVVFAKSTIAAHSAATSSVHLLFADGENSARDLQFHPEHSTELDAEKWMLRLFGSPVSQFEYRNHQLGTAHQPATYSALKSLFGQLGRTLRAGDRLFVYVTAHGGPAVQEYDYYDDYYNDLSSAPTPNARNTTIALWDEGAIDAEEFSQWLDRFDANVPIIMIMTQCYAGGFADTIFNGSDRKAGLNLRPRCGFFAQRHDRGAAGCTPEVNEADYEEYSTYFWAALNGLDRLGNPIESPDYNLDGKVQFAEAHAFVLLNSRTIDIPITTSEVLLRKYSQLRKSSGSKERAPAETGGLLRMFLGGANSATKSPPKRSPDSELLGATESLEQIIERANVVQRTVIRELAEQLQCDLQESLANVRRHRKQAKTKLASSESKVAVEYQRLEGLKTRLTAAVQGEWPELLESTFSPTQAALAGDRSEEFMAFIDAAPESKAIKGRGEKLKELRQHASDQANLEARWHRLTNVLEIVLLQENLARVATPEVIDHYQHVIELEYGSLVQ